MAYVNVAEWSPDQVAEWLKGLDDILQPYIHLFVTKNITGNHLLHLSPDDFGPLNIPIIGHQEIILQGVELLSNIHYQIHQENVQHLALRLSSKARSIYNELRASILDSKYPNGNLCDEEKEKEEKDSDGRGEESRVKVVKERVSTRVLSGVSDVLSSVKVLVSWFHRTPFHGLEHYDELKSHLLDLSIRLATIAQRDSFAENPVSIIRESCLKLAEMADAIIQDSKDPLILQPAFLDVVTIKKRADDSWGLNIYSSYHGVHQISMLRPLSPAHTCGKLMGGDQVVQVNYQTVVGWTSPKVTHVMQENPAQMILTVKKCPRHVNTITEIYFKPFRLPSKKRTYSPWVHNAIANHQYDLQSIPNLPFRSCDGRSTTVERARPAAADPLLLHPKAITPPAPALNSSGSDVAPTTASSSDASDDDDLDDLDDDAFLSDVDFGGTAPSLSVRLFQPKPRPHVQRRATIPGASARHTLPFDHLFQGYCQRHLVEGSHKDASTSYLYRIKDQLGAEGRAAGGAASARPHTCIGTEKKRGEEEQKEEEGEGEGEGGAQSHWRSCRREQGEMPFIDESDEREEEEEKEEKEKEEEEKEKAAAKKRSSAALHSSSPAAAGGETCSHFSSSSSLHSKKNSSCSSSTSTLKMDTPSPGGKTQPCSSPPPPLGVSSPSSFPLPPPPFSPPSSPPKSPMEFLEEDLQPLRRRSSLERPKLDKSYSSPTYDFDDREDEVFLQESPDVKRSPARAKEGGALPPPVKGHHAHPSTDTPSPAPHDGSVSIRSSRDSAEGEVASTRPSMSPVVEAGKETAATPVSPLPTRLTTPLATKMTFAGGSNRLKGNRRISCRELGVGDHHGWLFLRKDSKGFLLSHRWEKRWYILKKSYLYGYRDRDALKADSLIYLPGFHVCPAPDVKSKRFAFKIYHTSGATFYFACDTAEERSRWMSQMGVSAISSSLLTRTQHPHEPDRDTPALSPEAYYSETDDDELDKSPSQHQRSPRDAHSNANVTMSPLREGGGKLQGASSPPDTTTSPKLAKTTMTPTSYPRGGDNPPRMSPLGSLSSLAGGKQGLRFLQSSKGALSHPLPTSNFRSYVRVRECPQSPPAPPESPSKAKSPPAPSEGGGKGVRRKGSLRERLKHLPSSLTLDRRKNLAKATLSPGESPSPLKSKSETSLLDAPPNGAFKKGPELSPSRSSSQLPSYMRPTHASSLHTDGEAPPPSKGGSRRGSIGGLSGSSSSLRSLSPRRGSLDCLVSGGGMSPPPPTSPSAGSTGSLSAHEEYREGSPEKLWISSLRGAGRTRSPEAPDRPGPAGDRSRLKRAGNYQPLHRNTNKAELMQLAFELSLSSSSASPNRTSSSPSHHTYTPSRGLHSSATTPPPPLHYHHHHAGATPPPYSYSRPQVPPRTKFLSPSERLYSTFPSPPSSATASTTPSTTPLHRTKAPPNLTLSPPHEDGDSPKTPLKPTMGVSMIGKQRRTPGVMSPREVFLFSPHSPSPSPSPSLPPSSTSRVGPGLKMEQMLPEYPGMEYPPTFEPEIYTLSLPRPSSSSSSSSPSHSSTPVPPHRPPLLTSPSPSAPSPTPSYVNISHVANTMTESHLKSYHHTIYVTSPCKESSSEEGMGGGGGGGGKGGRNPRDSQPPPLPPNKPSPEGVPPLPRHIQQRLMHLQSDKSGAPPGAGPLSSSTSSPPSEQPPQRSPANEYVSMGGPPLTMYQATPSRNRGRLRKAKDKD